MRELLRCGIDFDLSPHFHTERRRPRRHFDRATNGHGVGNLMPARAPALRNAGQSPALQPADAGAYAEDRLETPPI